MEYVVYIIGVFMLFIAGMGVWVWRNKKRVGECEEEMLNKPAK